MARIIGINLGAAGCTYIRVDMEPIAPCTDEMIINLIERLTDQQDEDTWNGNDVIDLNLFVSDGEGKLTAYPLVADPATGGTKCATCTPIFKGTFVPEPLPKIIIHVEDGQVQRVYTDDPNAAVFIAVDFDTETAVHSVYAGAFVQPIGRYDVIEDERIVRALEAFDRGIEDNLEPVCWSMRYTCDQDHKAVIWHHVNTIVKDDDCPVCGKMVGPFETERLGDNLEA